MKLLSAHLTSIPRGMGRGSLTIETGKSEWDVQVTDSRVFLISPPGWGPGVPTAARDAKGPRRIFEVPRDQVGLEWESSDGVIDATEARVARGRARPKDAE